MCDCRMGGQEKAEGTGCLSKMGPASLSSLSAAGMKRPMMLFRETNTRYWSHMQPEQMYLRPLISAGQASPKEPWVVDRDQKAETGKAWTSK